MARRPKKEETAPIVIHDEQGGIMAEYPSDLVDTIKATVAKGATDEELYMFLSIANQYDLNPFMKEIWFTKMQGEVAIMTSRDGYKKLAEKEPNFRKCQSMAVYENDEFEMELVMGEVMNITHKFKQNDRGNIIGAYAVLKTTDHDNYVSYVDFKEYDKRNNIWKRYPSAMIRKVAENDVYKRFAKVNGVSDFESMPNGFRNELAEEEMDFSEEFEPIDIQQVIDDTIEESKEE
jgi:phage recombination protein Bet